jgi:DNA-binding beta-propeller fold protein YncE
MKHTWVVLPAFGLLAALVGTAWAQQPTQTSPGKTPRYPRVNSATCYEVDSSWPRKPSEFVWKDVPGIAVDANDNVYVFTRSVPPVQVYQADGTFVRAWGQDTVGKAHHIKVARDGTIWLSDIGLHVVRQFTPEGKLLKTLGTPGEPGEDATHFDKPTDMVVTPAGDVFVTDGYGNNRVVHFDRDGKFVKQWGQLGNGPGDFSIPHAIALDSKGRLYIADRNNVRIQVYDQQGKLLNSCRDLMVPWGLAMMPDDTLWACGSSPMPWRDDPKYPNATPGIPPKDQLFLKFDTATGKVLQIWTVPKGEDSQERPGDLNWVHCIAVDSHGNLYAGDINGKRAQKFVRRPGEQK